MQAVHPTHNDVQQARQDTNEVGFDIGRAPRGWPEISEHGFAVNH
jgi:hypothetical protein